MMDTGLTDLLTEAERDAVMAPIETAMTLPAQAYDDETWFRLEIERIFTRNWIGVLFACELPSPGDVRPFDLGGMPLVAIRGPDGRLRAFHNICPYDGCLAVRTARSGLDEIETYYHGWRYDLQGKLVAAPYWNLRPDCGPEGLGGRSGNLVEIRAEERLGVLFLDLDGKAPAIDTWLGPWHRLVAEQYAVGRLVPARDSKCRPLIERRTIAANWKTYQENASINILHAPFTHDVYRNSPNIPRIAKDGSLDYEFAIEDALLAFAYDRDQSGRTFDAFNLPGAGPDPSRMPVWRYFTTLYPNVNIPLLDVFTKINLALPLSAGRTEVQHLRFYAPEALEAENFLTEEASLQSLFDIVHLEDQFAIEAVQQARRSPVWRQHYYAPEWDALHHRFNQLVMADMERP